MIPFKKKKFLVHLKELWLFIKLKVNNPMGTEGRTFYRFGQTN